MDENEEIPVKIDNSNPVDEDEEDRVKDSLTQEEYGTSLCRTKSKSTRSVFGKQKQIEMVSRKRL